MIKGEKFKTVRRPDTHSQLEKHASIQTDAYRWAEKQINNRRVTVRERERQRYVDRET